MNIRQEIATRLLQSMIATVPSGHWEVPQNKWDKSLEECRVKRAISMTDRLLEELGEKP